MKLTVTWLDEDKGLVSASTDGKDPLPCGTVFWAGDEWLYQPGSESPTQAINVDPEQTEQFRQERLAIAYRDASVRPALEAEWEGRIRLYRDDSRVLAEIGARVEAKRWLTREARSTGTVADFDVDPKDFNEIHRLHEAGGTEAVSEVLAQYKTSVLMIQAVLACTGWADEDGVINHDGDTCPIHEA